MRFRHAICALFAIGAAVPAATQAADPGRWTQTNETAVPLNYYQGITADPTRHLYFNGVYFGLYRTDDHLAEEERNDDVIPPDVHFQEGYDHIGDITWAPGDGEAGRILLPLECYYPVPGLPSNTCPQRDFESQSIAPGTASIGVAGADDLQWKYYVRLAGAPGSPIYKAMWNELSPDLTLVWTQGSTDKGGGSKDLLAYRLADINEAGAGSGQPIAPVRVLKNVVPPSGITGAAFLDHRLYIAGQDAEPGFQVWSMDVTGCDQAVDPKCDARLEIEKKITGESEGLLAIDALKGVLHWQIQPYNQGGYPTYGVSNGTILSFTPKGAKPPASTPQTTPQPGAPPAEQGAVAGDKASSQPRCLPRALRIRSGGLGPIRLGRRLPYMGPGGAPRAVLRGRTATWCVDGGGSVRAVTDGARQIRLIVTGGTGHFVHGLHPGSTRRQAARVFPDAFRDRARLHETRRSKRVVIGLRKGIVSFIGLADRRLVRRPAVLRSYLRRL